MNKNWKLLNNGDYVFASKEELAKTKQIFKEATRNYFKQEKAKRLKLAKQIHSQKMILDHELGEGYGLLQKFVQLEAGEAISGSAWRQCNNNETDK